MIDRISLSVRKFCPWLGLTVSDPLRSLTAFCAIPFLHLVKHASCPPNRSWTTFGTRNELLLS